MKTYLTYGFLLTLASFLLTLVLFLCGLQPGSTKYALGQSIGFIGGLGIAIGFLVSGIKARRGAIPAAEGFSYGQAVGAGVLIQLFASLFGVVTTYLYFAVINPNFTDRIVQTRIDKLQSSGMSEDQIDRAEHMMRILASPPALTAVGFFNTLFLGTIIVLIAAAFLKRSAPENVAPAAA